MKRTFSLLGRQLLAIWQQLGINQRISIVLAAGVVVIALFSLAFWSSRVDFALLYGKLDDAEAAKVITVLDEMKVPHKSGQAGGAIYVPRDQVHLMHQIRTFNERQYGSGAQSDAAPGVGSAVAADRAPDDRLL